MEVLFALLNGSAPFLQQSGLLGGLVHESIDGVFPVAKQALLVLWKLPQTILNKRMGMD